MITLERNNKWYTDCIDIIKNQQENPIWLPETVVRKKLKLGFIYYYYKALQNLAF